MEEFKSIMVPVDDGHESKMAYNTALDLAELTGANITLLHVIDVEAPVLGGIETNIEKERKREGIKIISELSDTAEERDIDLDPVLIEGEPKKQIVELSRDHDMVIMSTRRTSTLGSVIMGSVADHVMRNACCPVLLSRLQKQ